VANAPKADGVVSVVPVFPVVLVVVSHDGSDGCEGAMNGWDPAICRKKFNQSTILFVEFKTRLVSQSRATTLSADL
jgi:hypothetical protein